MYLAKQTEDPGIDYILVVKVESECMLPTCLLEPKYKHGHIRLRVLDLVYVINAC